VEVRRKSPDELLRELQVEEAAHTRRGHLKIFLGYASGVGKTFRMLEEARRRTERGQDVVVAALQPDMPPEADALLGKLQVIPLLQGSALDVAALLRRRPTVCIVDGLAYGNPPGSRNPTRWHDVQELLDANIKVITSINIQYVEELREQVEAITGKHVTDTVPRAFIQSADEIEIVDAPAEEQEESRALRLSRLRELTLVLAADVVDHQLQDYLQTHGIRQHFGTQERILVCATPRANMEEMLETARAIAERFHAELIVAYVRMPHLSAPDQAALDARLDMARAAGASIEILEGEDAGEALLEFARSRGITQLFVGHSRRTGIARLKGTPIDKLIWEGHGMDVHVFPQQDV
jgi:two-component system sensor histidine kinase KdpD